MFLDWIPTMKYSLTEEEILEFPEGTQSNYMFFLLLFSLFVWKTLSASIIIVSLCLLCSIVLWRRLLHWTFRKCSVWSYFLWKVIFSYCSLKENAQYTKDYILVMFVDNYNGVTASNTRIYLPDPQNSQLYHD